MIQRIELVNFMSHERTVIEPSPGLTVLVGPNNCGKSAFVTALQILAHNAKSNYVMRHGEKLCEIVVETDDGHVVQWSRKKSGSPKYLIDGQEFDRLKQSVPEELNQILGLAKVECDKDQFDVHFGEQKSPVFLLNDSGKAAAQFFASSSDAIRLVEMQDRHKTKVRFAKRDHARLSQDKNRLTDSLETLAPLDSIETRLTDLETQYAEINHRRDEIQQVEIMLRALDEVEQQYASRRAMSDCLGKLTVPPTFADTAALARLIDKTENLERGLGDASARAEVLGSITPPPEIKDEPQLERMVQRMRVAERNLEFQDLQIQSLQPVAPPPVLTDQSPLDNLLKALSSSERKVEASERELKAALRALDSLQGEFEDWVALNPTCPTCGGETVVDQLIGSSGGHHHG